MRQHKEELWRRAGVARQFGKESWVKAIETFELVKKSPKAIILILSSTICILITFSLFLRYAVEGNDLTTAWHFGRVTMGNHITVKALLKLPDFGSFGLGLSFLFSAALLLFDLFFVFHEQKKSFIAAYIFTGVLFFVILHLYVINLFGNMSIISTLSVINGHSTSDGYTTTAIDFAAKFPFFLDLFSTYISFILLPISLVYHYFFVKTIEGPSLSDFFSEWTKQAADYLQNGQTSVKQFATMLHQGSLTLKVKLPHHEFFKEITILSRNMSSLEGAILQKFSKDLEGRGIGRIIKEGDVLIETDEDVSRLQSGLRLIVSLGHPLTFDNDIESPHDHHISERSSLIADPQPFSEYDSQIAFESL